MVNCRTRVRDGDPCRARQLGFLEGERGRTGRLAASDEAFHRALSILKREILRVVEDEDEPAREQVNDLASASRQWGVTRHLHAIDAFGNRKLLSAKVLCENAVRRRARCSAGA